MVLKKIFAVAVCCFLLAALALPVFAYETPWDWYDTRWHFDSVLSGDSWGGSLLEVWDEQMMVTFSVDSYSGTWTDPEWDGTRLSFYSSSDYQRITIYDEQGWVDSGFRFMRIISGPQNRIDQLVRWMAKNAVCIASGNTFFPEVTVRVSGVLDHDTALSFNFAGSNPTSAITLYVDSDGGTFTHGLRSYFVPSVEASRFLGFDGDGDGVADFVPGQTYEIGAGHTSATTVSLSAVYSENPILTTTVTIYNNDGTLRRFSYTATSSDSSSGLSPVLRMRINAYGANFYSGDTLVATWLVAGNDEEPEGFLGLTGKRFGNFPSYGLGADITLGGQSTSSEYTFYIVYNTLPSTPDVDWTSWIITAVGGFFDFELWPGLSLGDLLLVVISIGVLFAFLKITI